MQEVYSQLLILKAAGCLINIPTALLLITYFTQLSFQAKVCQISAWISHNVPDAAWIYDLKLDVITDAPFTDIFCSVIVIH